MLRVVLAVLLLVTGGARASAGVSPDATESLATEVPVTVASMQAEQLLGFRLGEERRYVTGPIEDKDVDMGRWSIRLEEIFTVDGEPEGLFTLDHEWVAPPPVGEPVLGQIVGVNSEGTVRVNAHGYPLMIRFQTLRHLSGFGDQGYTVDFELSEDGDRYEKRTTFNGERWYQNVGVRRHDTVDRDGRSGLFAFLPRAPGCLDSPKHFVDTAGSMPLIPRSPGSSGTPQPNMPNSFSVTDNSDCEESMFAHLGLLSLAMPALWEAQGEREYVFLTPIGPEGEPDSRVALGGTGVTTPYGPAGISSGRGFPPPGSTRRLEGGPLSRASYHDTETLEFVERVSVQVGSRTIDAWLIELSNGFGPIYVDDDGRVVRMDLPARGGLPERWIRMLWPSEF